MLRPRTTAALRAARAAGIHVVIATGRMYRSVRPYADAAGIDAPLVCYQGAAVVDPVTGEWLLHEPIPLELAREAIAAVEAEGFALNCYVDDDLYVAAITEHARSYADFQSIPLHEVGDLLGWIERPPTKLVVVDDPDRLDALRPRLEEQFGEPSLHRQVAAVLPRAGEPGDLEGKRARLRRRASSASPPSRRSRSATARTISSCSTGPASASRSRTRTKD